MKWIGFLLIMAGCAGLGLGSAFDYRKRIETLMQVERMMHYIQEMIELEQLPLIEAIGRCRSRMNGIYAAFLEGVSERMEQFDGEDIALIWHRQAQEMKGHLTKQDYPAFYHCMDQTGFASAVSQAEVIRQYEKELSRTIGKLNDEREEKCRLYRSLGIIGGIFVCVLLF